MSRSLMRRSAPAGAAPISNSASAAANPGHRRAFQAFIRLTRHYTAPQRVLRARVTEGRPGFPGPPCSGGREAAGGNEGFCGLRDDRDDSGGSAPVEAERALNGHDQLEVQRMARVACDDVSRDPPAEQREIADEVERFVAHELVTIAETVQSRALADHDRVVERPTERAAALAQEAEIFEEPVRACRGVLGDERLFRRRPRQ